MLKVHEITAFAALAVLWGWILTRSDNASTGDWLLLVVPPVLWIVIDWFASGSGALNGPNKAPGSEERFFCYLFMGTGALPLMAAASGLMELERFKPGFLPTIFGDGIEVAAVCLLGFIAVPVVRLLGWSDALFGWSHHGGGGGGAGPSGGGC